MLSHKALHPNIVQHADGSTTNIGEGGFVPAERHRALYADAVIPRRPNYGVAPHGKPALERRDPRSAAPWPGHRDRRRDHPRPPAHAGGGRRGARPPAGRARRPGEPSTTRWSSSSETTATSTASTGSARSGAWPTRNRSGCPCSCAIRGRSRGGHAEGHGPDASTWPLRSWSWPGSLPAPEMDGRSLLPVLRGGETDWRRSFLIEYTSDIVFPRIDRMGYDAVRTERHKYVRYPRARGHGRALRPRRGSL